MKVCNLYYKSKLPHVAMMFSALLLLFCNVEAYSEYEAFDQVAQNRVIFGTVSSQDDGTALPGVNVIIKNTTIGTVTDIDGKYSISVPDEGAVLVFSFIGYSNQEVAINGRTTIDVMLVPGVELDEVVVVGYGTQKKVNLTGSVSNVEFDKTLENRPITDASQALAGQVPGLWVTQTSGLPGSDGAQLRIRGWGTLNNSEPMVIVDGVERPFDQINPNDIKEISVLKDAASAAIYGSRAANGVILVTTKSGDYDATPQIKITGYVGAQSLSRKYDIIDNSAEFMEIWNQALINGGASPIFPDNVINDFRNGDDPYIYPNTNFFDYVYRTAMIDQENISLSGGSNNSKYFFSLNRLNQNGIMEETWSARYSINFSIENKIKDWLTIGGRLNTMKRNSREPYSTGRISYMFSNGAYPFIAPFNRDGTFGAVQAFNDDGQPIVSTRSPVPELYNGYTKRDDLFARMDTYIDIAFTDYLVLKSNFTAHNSNVTTDRYNDGPVILDRIKTSTGIPGGSLDIGQIIDFEGSRENDNTFYYTWFNTLTFNKQFNEKHDLTAIAGMQLESTTLKNVFGLRKEAPKSGLTQINAGTSGTIAEGTRADLRMMSFFGRINYVLANKYLFEANIRTDGSSRFSEDNRWGVFPGFSAGWIISEEEFMSGQNLFSQLKIRGSWGKLGNQNITGYFPYLTTITQDFGTSYNFGGTLAPGAAVTSLVDESITWETTTSTDFGIEMYFLDNRLSLETVYFHKTTEDIITQLPIPRTLGNVTAPIENIGEMVNKGFEINATYSKASLDRDQFGYSLSGNFSYVTNEVTKFRGGDSPDQLYLIREGISYKSLYAYQYEGIYQSNQEGQEHMYANGYTPVAGDIRYTDFNGDGILNSEDLTVTGNTIPKYNFGANLNFTYKGFDLNILLQGLSGVTIDNRSRWTMPLGATGGTINKSWRNAWSPENTDTKYPHIKLNDRWNLRRDSDFWHVDLSYLKVKNIQLGYTFPSNTMGLQNLYAYVNLQNYFTAVNSDYEGFDPERSTFDIRADRTDAFINGYDAYPLPKIISVGVNIGF